MNNRQTTIVVLAAIALAVLAAGVLQSITHNISGGCHIWESVEIRSPEGSHLLVISQESCPSNESRTSIHLRDPGSANTYLQLLEVPSRFERAGNTIYPASFRIEWRGEDRVRIFYPNGLSAYAAGELVPIEMLNLSRLDMYGIRIDLEPYVL